MTLAPLRAKVLARARPMPWEAPVRRSVCTELLVNWKATASGRCYLSLDGEWLARKETHDVEEDGDGEKEAGEDGRRERQRAHDLVSDGRGGKGNGYFNIL